MTWAYGIKKEVYDCMLKEQQGVCSICKKSETALGSGGTRRPLSVDHCHESGRVRGLLCSKCNTAIGLMDDDKTRLRIAAQYLERYEQ
jgi:hypothetical protein